MGVWKEIMLASKSGMNENWPGVFDEYGVQFLILDRHEDGNLPNLFQAQPGWVVDFEDERAVIFARADCALSTD